MKRILTSALLLLAAATGALAQSAPANLPYHTVYGRMGGVPGDTGPGQAIPFSTLQHIFAGPVRLASSYGKASWCLNLIAALADIGPGPGTVLIDSTNEVPTICAATSTIMVGASKHIEFIDGALYSLNQTIQLGSGSSLQMLGGGMANSFTSAIGNRLLWQGAASGVMVRVFDANHAWVKDAVLDCGGVTNCTALHYDSDNNPISTMNFFENLTLVGAHVGVLVGNAGTSHPTADQCNVNPSQSGCHEMDFATFKNVYILGNCSDTTGEGFHINSQNSLQQSTIDTFIVQCVNIGIHQVFSAGSNTNIRNGNGGSTVGTSPVFIKTDSGGAIGMNLFNNETEGGWTYAVHDSGCNGSSLNFETWQQNVFSDPVLSDGCAQIVSNSNASSGGIGNFVAAGSSVVTSIGDAPDGAWTGNVSYYPTATHPLPANNGGSGFASYTVGDLLYADTTTHLAKLAGAAVNNVLISGGVGAAFSWGKVGNGALINPSTIVNGQTCTLGSVCTVTAAAAGVVVGTTTVTGGSTATNDLFFNNAGILGRIASANSGVLVTSAGGVPSVSTTLPNMALGTPLSVTLTNGTGLPTTGLTGALQAAQEPAHTGDVTNTAGSLALTIASSAVTYSKIASIGALSVMGRSANTSGTGADISATAASGAVLRENGSTIGFGTIATAGIADNAVTLAKLATQATNTVLANVTAGSAVPTALAVASCDTATKALQWTTNTGLACNTSITAAAVPASGLTGATLAAGVTASSLTSLGTITSLNATAIGAGTPGTAAFTTIAASGVVTLTNSTASTSLSTGALVVSTGGLAVAGAAYIGTGLGVGAHADPVGAGVTFDTNATNPTWRISGNSNNDQAALTFQHSWTANDQTWQMGIAGSSPPSGLASKDFYIRDGGGTAYFGITSGGIVKLQGGTVSTSSTTGQAVLTGGFGASGAIWAGTYVATTPTTVGGLPTCNSGLKGARMFVTDANATFTAGIGAAVVGGGANNVPVTCDGTSFKIGANDNIPALRNVA